METPNTTNPVVLEKSRHDELQREWNNSKLAVFDLDNEWRILFGWLVGKGINERIAYRIASGAPYNGWEV